MLHLRFLLAGGSDPTYVQPSQPAYVGLCGGEFAQFLPNMPAHLGLYLPLRQLPELSTGRLQLA